MKTFKTAIVDDDQCIRNIILPYFLGKKSEIKICGIYDNGISFLYDVTNKQPDLVLMDIKMPYLNGIETCKRLKKIYPKAIVICTSGNESEEDLLNMYHAGAKGFIHKHFSFGEICDCLKEVTNGNFYVSQQIPSLVLHQKIEELQMQCI